MLATANTINIAMTMVFDLRGRARYGAVSEPTPLRPMAPLDPWDADPEPPPARSGKIVEADFQSAQPSRHTSESPATRPSAIHRRMMSPAAGPNWLPDAGRTYHMAWGASEMGSLANPVGATAAVTGAAATAWAAAGAAGRATAVAGAGPVGTARGVAATAAGPPAGAAAASAGTAAAGVAAVPSLTVATVSPPSVALVFAGMRIFEPQWGHMPRLPAKNALTFSFFPQLSQWNLIPIAVSSKTLNEWPNQNKPAPRTGNRPTGTPPRQAASPEQAQPSLYEAAISCEVSATGQRRLDDVITNTGLHY